MIFYLKRHELNVTKYNTCIQQSVNTRIYAYSWYLDVVADCWDVLVLNDYEAVMPLPWRKKVFLKYIYPPAWTQQLGVFSKLEIETSLLKEFIAKIPKKFVKVTVQFNSGNEVDFLPVTKLENYVLELKKSTEELTNKFNTNRKRVLSKGIKLGYKIDKSVAASEFLKFYQLEHSYSVTPNNMSVLKKIITTLDNNVNIWGIRKEHKLIAGLVWLKDDNRLTYLLPEATHFAKKQGLPTLLIFELINDYSESNLILDFEGSMLPGVSNFYKSFGALKEAYSYVSFFKIWNSII